jgi:hypothetical protein
MASTYVNNLRLEEMATGEKSGTWGTISNTNLELLGQAWGSGTESFASDADTTITISDGSSDDARAFFLNVTSGVSLTTTRTMTLAPNTVNKVWIIKNSTSGSQSINISQGTGSNVTIANGATLMVYTDGAGSGAAVSQIDLLGGGGGTLTGNLNFDDDVKAQFGDSQDLQIYHDGSNSFIDDAGTGNLQIRASSQIKLQKYTGENMFVGIADGAASMYYDNAQKIATASGGVTVTGTVTADGLVMGDDEEIQIGNSTDLRIYHDSVNGNSVIRDAGTGNLRIMADDFQVTNAAATVNLIFANDSTGVVTLYHNGNAKLETTSYGIDISGSVVADTQTTTKSGSPAPNFDDYQNFVWTLTGNITLLNPSTEKTGQTGFFIFIHSGGARTVSLGTDYETAGGAGLTLSSTSGAVDIVPYVVQSSGNILLGTPQLAFS